MNGACHSFEVKLPKIPEVKDYNVTLGGGFLGYLGSAVIVRKSDHPILGLLADHQNMNLQDKSDLIAFESQINPKRNRRQFLIDTALIVCPIATSTSGPSSVSTNFSLPADNLLDLVQHRRRIELLGETFVWFKTSKGVDFDKLGGFKAFLMVLSIISKVH